MKVIFLPLFISALESFRVPPPPRRSHVTRPAFRRIFGRADEKDFPTTSSSPSSSKGGNLSPEELISEARRLRDEAKCDERELFERKLVNEKDRLAEIMEECEIDRGDQGGGAFEKGNGDGGGFLGQGRDCDIDAVAENIKELERKLKGEVAPGGGGGEGQEGERQRAAGEFAGMGQDGGGRGPRGLTSRTEASSSTNQTDVLKDLILSAYSDCPSFLKPLFAGGMGIEYNTSRSEDGAYSELRKLINNDPDLPEVLEGLDEVFEQLMGNETNATAGGMWEWDDLKALDGQSSDLDMMVSSTMPTSVTESTVSLAELELLQEQVLSKPGSGWESQSKGEKVPGGWIVRGQWKGNITFEEIDLLLSGQKFPKNKPDEQVIEDVTVCYVVDPTPLTEDQMELGQEPSGVLYVTQKPVIKQSLLAGVVTGISLMSLAAFSLGSFALNDEGAL